MENLIVSANAVLPLMICIGVGYLAKLMKLGDDKFFIKCNSFCFKVFMSMMMFVNIYDADITTAFQPALILFAVAAILLIAAGAFFAVRALVKDGSRRAVLTQAIFRSNYVIFGIPVAANLYGEGNIATAALLSAVAVPLFNVLAVFTLEFYSDRRTGVKSLLKGIVTNPLILGAAAALVMKAMPFGLPAAVHEAVSDLGQVATPLSLVILGATFRFGAVRKNLRWLSIGIIGKTVVVPLLTIPAAILCGFRGIALLSLTILFASPTAVTSFTMAEAAGHDGELAGQQVVFSSIISLFTVFLWIFALKSFALI
ncbi:MAG TPA: AEC family transporter [Candidatus Merdivicinus faecavium]|nr:AEC family transporter [Candidatus Merdivicinus faecavium]